MEAERKRMLGRIGRALPSVLGIVVGLWFMRGYDDQWVSWAGWAVFLYSTLRIVQHPALWWRYVVSGVAPTPPTDAKYTQPGRYQVELLGAGDRPIEVVKALREVSSLGLVEAKQLIDGAPTIVATNISESSATHVRDRISRAGGTANLSTPSSKPA